MKLDAGVEALPSKAGLFFTFILTVIVLGYTIVKADVLIYEKDVDIMSVVKKDFFEPEEPFVYSQGLAFAVALTAYDEVKEPILDPSIGEVIFEAYEFGQDNMIGETYTKLPTHYCTDEELGIDSLENKF